MAAPSSPYSSLVSTRKLPHQRLTGWGLRGWWGVCGWAGSLPWLRARLAEMTKP